MAGLWTIYDKLCWRPLHCCTAVRAHRTALRHLSVRRHICPRRCCTTEAEFKGGPTTSPCQDFCTGQKQCVLILFVPGVLWGMSQRFRRVMIIVSLMTKTRPQLVELWILYFQFLFGRQQGCSYELAWAVCCTLGLSEQD